MISRKGSNTRQAQSAAGSHKRYQQHVDINGAGHTNCTLKANKALKLCIRSQDTERTSVSCVVTLIIYEVCVRDAGVGYADT